MEKDNELVLVVRDSWLESNHYGIGSWAISFGMVNKVTGKYSHISYWNNELANTRIRCQWNTTGSEYTAPYHPYAIRVQADDVTLTGAEPLCKVFRKIKKHLYNVPLVNGNFGQYCYEVGRSLKITHYVRNPEQDEHRENCPTYDIKDIVCAIQATIQNLNKMAKSA